MGITTAPKRFVRRDYEDLNVNDNDNDIENENENENENVNVNVNVNVNDNNTDIAITSSNCNDDEFIDERSVRSSTSRMAVLFGNNNSGGSNTQKKHNSVVRRCVLSFVALAVALALVAFLTVLVVSRYLLRDSSSSSPTGWLVPNTTMTTTDETDSIEPPPESFDTESPFFEHVLQWKEVPLAHVLSDFDSNNNSNSGTTNTTTANDSATATDRVASNHYKASIEFCSDPDTALYGYGPVGKCVPGRAAPLIRMTPKRYGMIRFLLFL